jgi:hypothetical protein
MAPIAAAARAIDEQFAELRRIAQEIRAQRHDPDAVETNMVMLDHALQVTRLQVARLAAVAATRMKAPGHRGAGGSDAP